MASASIYAEPIGINEGGGFDYRLHCAISWGYKLGQYGSAITYIQFPESQEWHETHSQTLLGEDYLEWVVWQSFGGERVGQVVYIQMGVPGMIGSNVSRIDVGAGMPITPSPVTPIYEGEPPYVPPVVIPPYIEDEPPVTPLVPSCMMTAIGAPLILLGFLRTRIRPNCPAWFVKGYYLLNRHILSIFF